MSANQHFQTAAESKPIDLIKRDALAAFRRGGRCRVGFNCKVQRFSGKKKQGETSRGVKYRREGLLAMSKIQDSDTDTLVLQVYSNLSKSEWKNK